MGGLKIEGPLYLILGWSHSSVDLEFHSNFPSYLSGCDGPHILHDMVLTNYYLAVLLETGVFVTNYLGDSEELTPRYVNMTQADITLPTSCGDIVVS